MMTRHSLLLIFGLTAFVFHSIFAQSGDCPDARLICDKTTVTIAGEAPGPGNDDLEMDDALCFQGIFVETASFWQVFTVASAGTLTFTITPQFPNHDLDFVVYRLPNGVGDCTDKEVVRCMAAGELFTPSPCMGPTGLNFTADDTEQDAGCLDFDDDNWLRFMNVVAGESYALVVNNYSSDFGGYKLEWGGTANFAKPQAGLLSSDPDGMVCLFDSVVFTDNSTFPGGQISSWQWSFGADATPSTASVENPGPVRYSTPGPKTVSLTVGNGSGCESTFSFDFTVDPCCTIEASFTVGQKCLLDSFVFVDNSTFPDGQISSWQWSFGADATPSTASVENPDPVRYSTPGQKTVSLTVGNGSGCESTFSFDFKVDLCCTIEASVAVEQKCPGDPGAPATATVKNFNGPLSFDWSDGQMDATAANLQPGKHSVTVSDGIGCMDTVSFLVDSLEFELAVSKDTTIIEGKSVTLTATPSVPGTTLTWTGVSPGSDPTSVLVTPSETTIYYVNAKLGSCEINDSIRVNVVKEVVAVPSAFTPNGDEKNDQFFPVVKGGAEVLEFQIWTRWGELVHEGLTGWDGNIEGTPAASDIYVYRCLIRRADGTEEPARKGDFVLLR